MAITKEHHKQIMMAFDPHGQVIANGINERERTVDELFVVTKDILTDEDLERIFKMLCEVPHRIYIEWTRKGIRISMK